MVPVCSPVTPREVFGVLSWMKCNTTPGPDGVKCNNLLWWYPKDEQLSHLFNVMVYCGMVPCCLKRSYPKHLKYIGWQMWTYRGHYDRPILLQAFSEIPTVGVCEVHIHQKGFVRSPGCLENLALLDGILQTCKQNRTLLNVIFIDFAMDFDTGSHKSTYGVDGQLQDLIKDSYKGFSTHTRLRGGRSGL